MIIGNRIVKLIDFGMAKHFDFSDNSVTDYDMASSTVVGTVVCFDFFIQELFLI